MKGINLKRIGAIVAGATILASSVAFAGPVYFGDTPLVTDGGQPVVKVVVGADAAASDGVAAANIAAHLAHEAFKSDTYTAMTGDVSCTASGDAGTCTITDKSVTLQVTVPGAEVTGSYTLKTLIGDYIDRILGDRGTSSADQFYNVSNAETSSIANPNTNGDTTATYISSAPSESYFFKITGTMFEPMEDFTVKDKEASTEYKEEQNFWVGGGSSGGWVRYDSTIDDLALTTSVLEYTVKFSGSSHDLGIPVCSQAVNTTLFADCLNSGSTLSNTYQTETHKVEVMFLGEKWIISDMSPPGSTTSSNDENILVPGGYVKLAKESQTGVLNKGESLDVGTLKFMLEDVALGTGASNIHAALISVYEEGVEVPLKEGVSIDPATTEDINVEGYGSYKIHVYETGPGYSFGTTWADMAIFSEELKLEDGSDLDPDVGLNDYWKVSLGWKNKGGSTSDRYPDHLRTIIIYSDEIDDLLGDNDWEIDDSIPVVQDPAAWQLTFAGLDIGDDDRKSLTFSMERDSTKSLTVNSSGAKCNITAPYVHLKAPEGKNFNLPGAELPAASGSQPGYDNEAYIALAPSNAIACPDGVFITGSVAMKSGTSSTSYYVVENNSLSGSQPGIIDIDWDFMGSSLTYSQGGEILVAYNRSYANVSGGFGIANFAAEPKAHVVFMVSEEVGEGESANTAERFVFGTNYSGTNGASTTFNFDGASTTTYFDKDHVFALHYGPASGSNATVEEGYVTERGSIFKSIDDESVKFLVADEVAHAQVTLSSAASGEVEPDTVTFEDMVEGQEETVPGTDVKVKVVEIKATGTCDTGAGGTPVCEVSGDATAYLADSEGANVGSTLEAVTMYSGSMDLVVLDSDVSAGTLVSVGGPVVNTVTADAQAEGDLALEAEGDTVVTQVGNTIVVAGYSAEDTLAAADEFLAQLQ